MRPRTALRAMMVAGIGLVGCNALIDVKDVFFDPNAAVPGSDGGADGAGGEGGTSAEAGVDSGPCMAELQTDPKHCGRCNHDCVGGTCTAGKCEPVLLAAGLGGPSAIALGKDHVYVTAYSADAVLAVAKDGTGANVLVSSEERAHGVAVVGTTLYWANGDYPFDGTSYKGGIWQCSLPACAPATRRLIAAGNWPNYPIPRGNNLYFNESNNSAVVRAPIDGGPTTLIAGTTQPYALAVDDVHAYYTSSQPKLYRAKLDGTSVVDGGVEEEVGPSAVGQGGVGFVAVDDQRVYWAFFEEAGKGHVQSVSKASPAAGSVTYGTDADNVFPMGVVLDDKNVYWSTCGSGTPATPTGDGKVFACPKAGCGAVPPVVLATGNVCAGQMAIDDVAIYWAEYGSISQASGRVRKVAKP